MNEISPQHVKDQLERILSSSEFKNGNRLSQFLRYIVEQTLDGNAKNIKQYTVAIEAFKYGTEFNPQTNPIVRIEAQRLRRALSHYYHDDGCQDPIQIEIPKGSYIPKFTQLDSINPISGTEADAKLTEPSEGRLAIDTEGPPTIAVITFSNLSEHQKFTYLSSGITEELIVGLNNYPECHVIGPFQPDRLIQDGLGPKEIGARFGARFVLDGSVRGYQNRIRLVAKLIDARSGSNLWVESYDHEYDAQKLLELEREISRKVSGTIADPHGKLHRIMFNELAEKSSDAITGHEALLKYYHYLQTVTLETYEEARDSLLESHQPDSKTSQVMAALAGIYLDEFTHFGGTHEALDHAVKLIDAAFSLNQNDHLVLGHRGYIYYYAVSIEKFLRAVDLAVQTNPWRSCIELGLFCSAIGHTDKGMELYKFGRQVNPHHAGYMHYTPFFAHSYNNDFELALASARKIQMPEYFMDPVARAVAQGHLGKKGDAVAAVQHIFQLVPNFKESGKELIQRIFRYEQPVGLLVEGLKKAGLELR